MTLSHLIRTTRQKKGWTMNQLAEKVGYNPSYFSLLERGLRRLDDQAVVRTALVLGLDPSEALLASLRERLPAELRKHVPEQPGRMKTTSVHSLFRQYQADDFDFEVGLARFDVTSDWDGNVTMVRTFTDCRPTATGRLVAQVTFRDRLLAVAKSGDAPKPKLEVLSKPEGLEYSLSTDPVGDTVHHTLVFPKGWRRSAKKKQDAFSFRIKTYQPGGLFLDTSKFVKQGEMVGVRNPVLGCLSIFVKHFIQRLEVSLDLPRKYKPERWEPWVWWGSGPLEAATRNLEHKGSRSIKFRSEASHAEMMVVEPLTGYTFSIGWTPLEFSKYLEVRYGGPNARKTK